MLITRKDFKLSSVISASSYFNLCVCVCVCVCKGKIKRGGERNVVGGVKVRMSLFYV